MYKTLKKIAKRYDLAIATFALSISAFCVFVTMGILSVLFEHDAATVFNVVVVSSLLVINMWAVYLNVARLSQIIKKRIEQ